MPFAQIEDGRMFYEVRGAGSPVVLLHGAWASHQWWRWQVPELSGNYRLLLPDLRGHGRSEPLTRPFSITGFSKDLSAFVRHVDIDAYALIGWSLGGMVAMQHCLDDPSKVRAMVLMATRGHRSRTMKTRIIFQYVRMLVGLFWDLAAPRTYDRTVGTAETQTTAWIERETGRVLSSSAPGEVFDWMVEELGRNPRKNYFPVARSIWNWEAGAALREIRVPTLILVGEDDHWTPPQFSRLMQAEIPRSTLVMIKGAGHYMAMERAGRVNAEIIRFLEDVGYV